jgi:predicted O-methyltransferase YrrM
MVAAVRERVASVPTFQDCHNFAGPLGQRAGAGRICETLEVPAQRWSDVDEYIETLFLPPDAAFDEALASSNDAGLPPISVSYAQGKFLGLLAKMSGARRILEIGTLGGFSTIWLARSLPPDGVVITLELESKHAVVARANLDRAGVGALVDVRVGPAVATLRDLIAQGVEPFDFIFIDADKEGYPQYLDLTMRLARVGTVIVADNVVRDGQVVDAASDDERVVAVREFLELAAANERLDGDVIQTVGAKGYDGFALFIVSS